MFYGNKYFQNIQKIKIFRNHSLKKKIPSVKYGGKTWKTLHLVYLPFFPLTFLIDLLRLWENKYYRHRMAHWPIKILIVSIFLIKIITIIWNWILPWENIFRVMLTTNFLNTIFQCLIKSNNMEGKISISKL